MSNAIQVAGHVVIEDRAVIGGYSAFISSSISVGWRWWVA